MAYVTGGYPYWGYGQDNPYYGYSQDSYNYPYFGNAYPTWGTNPQGSYNYPYFGNAYPTWGTNNFNKDRWLNNRPVNNTWWW